VQDHHVIVPSRPPAVFADKVGGCSRMSLATRSVE
jgi:hypothetical protein